MFQHSTITNPAVSYALMGRATRGFELKPSWQRLEGDRGAKGE